jgi:hypothetical protein
MQTWQIKVLKLEASVLDDLNEFVHAHALYCLLGLMGLLTVLMAWVLAGGLRRRFPQQAGRVPPVIIVQSPISPPPEPDDWNPFPPPHYYWREDNCDPDEWED